MAGNFKVKLNLTQADKDKISTSIAKAELTTSGEIVPVLFSSCDLYRAAHYKSAIFFSLSFCFILYLLPIELAHDPISYFFAQGLGLLFGYLIAFIPSLKVLFCSKDELAEEVKQRATQAFLANNLHQTRDRTGILIMISMLERRVEILADTGINQLVGQSTWDDLVAKIISEIKNDNLVEGFSKGILECGEILSKNFPIKDDDKNELGNSLITDY